MNWTTAICIALTVFITGNVKLTYGDFDLVLKSQSAGSYLNYTGIPNIGSFSISFWIKQEYTGPFWPPQTILSYANDDHKKALEFNSVNGGMVPSIVVYYYGKNIFVLMANCIKDHHWHHFCFTFDNQKLRLDSYVDGVQNPEHYVNHVTRGTEIKGGGCLVVGYNQKQKCSPPESQSGFTGLISQVNIWNEVLGPSDVIKVYRGCDAYHGNLFPWKLASLHKSIVRENIMQPTSACRERYFSRTYIHKENRILIGHTLSHQSVTSVLQCARGCLNDRRCQSFNYYDGRELNNCELNDSDDIKHPVSLRDSSNVSYGTYIDILERL